MKLKLGATTKHHKMSTGEEFGDGKQRQQREELLPTVFEVDTVLGPGIDTSEVRRTIPNTAVKLFPYFEVHSMYPHVFRSHTTFECTILWRPEPARPEKYGNMSELVPSLI